MEKSTLSVLCDFLRHPVVEVRLADADEVETLRVDLARAKDEAAQARFKYAQEASRCLRYEDYFRANGIDPATVK